MTTLERLLSNPRAVLRALDCLDARESFHTFCGLVEIPTAPVEDDPDEDVSPGAYRPPRKPTAAHLIELCSVLQAIDDGRVKRAMFFLPPGSAKSTYASVLFPPYFLGRKKGRTCIVATYGSEFARKLGRRARSVIQQRVFREIFGACLDPSSAAADEWLLTNGNEYMAGGIRSGIMGNRADLLVIDDPIKGREQAESDGVRESTRDAYQDDLLTRLKPGGAVIIVQTRWHDADLAGSILPEDYDGQSGWVKCRDGKWWYIVSIPAQAERADDPLGRRIGQYIWPEWFGRSEPDAANPGESHFAPFKLNPRTWASLFQQRPRPADGTYFQRDWFKRYEAGREHPHLNRYITSDHAPGGQVDSDFSCVRVWGIDPEGDIWLLDGFRHQATMDVTADLVVGNAKNPSRPEHEPIVEGLIRKHRPFAWFPEDDNNWKAVAGFVQRRLREEGLGCRVEPVSPHGRDKAAKAQSFQGMAASGRVWLPLTPAGEDVLSEYLKFPTGAHDDEVDAAGIIGRVIDEAHPAIVPTTRGPEVRRRYSKKKPASVWAT